MQLGLMFHSRLTAARQLQPQPLMSHTAWWQCDAAYTLQCRHAHMLTTAMQNSLPQYCSLFTTCTWQIFNKFHR